MEPPAGNGGDSGTDAGHLQAVAGGQRRRGVLRQPVALRPRPPRQASPRPSRQSAEAAKYHKVKKGETLSSIAESNHTSVAALKRDNPKLAANLRAGEVLVIRK